MLSTTQQQCRCHRCNGSGQVGGNGRVERPWSSFEALTFLDTLEKVLGMQKPRECPGCRGSGTKGTGELPLA